MLHKSFKPAKCKTTLKLAASRIKLLKNKRDAQVKQLKRELAQLLESGQDQTARIRVEHVVREEKTMAAYELIEIYCELIVARLPIIESQKGCPIDLKEAISSVIFASPRCADIPELMDVRKHFTAKYGKDFVTAAVELRPDCGVSRLLVEKLSAKAPDGPTKVKILSTIAEEHNIKWDPKSFEEKNNPPVDLLNGPNTFEQPTRSPPEVQNIQRPSNSANKVPSNFEVTSQHHEKHDAPSSTFGSRTTHQNLRHGGSEEMEDRYLENREVGSFSMGKQVLKMEFADATAAAQAAAESAERASMAARAAAELSSRGRMSTQPSMEKQNHPAFMSQDDRIQSDLNPRFPGEYNAKQPANDSFDTRDSGKHHHELSDNELNERFYKLKKSNTSHQRIPSKPSGSPVNEYPTDDEDRSSLSRQCTDSERKPERRFENEKKSDYAASFKEDSRQPSKGFSHAFGHNREDSMPSEFKPVNKDEETVELESPFVTHEGETQGSSRDSNSQANAAAVFDDSGSDNELVNFDGEENFRNSNYLSSEGGVPSDLLGSTNIWSPSQKASISLGKHDTESPFVLEQQSGSSDLLRSANIWSPRQQAATTLGKSDSQSPFVSEQQPDTITFDESDGENDLNKFTPGEKESSADVSPFRAKEYVGYNRKTELDHSSDDSDVEIHSWKDSRTEIRNEISGNDQSQISQPSNLEDFDKREKEAKISSDKYELDTKYVRDSSSEAANELNLGSLKGGLRNKGYKHPPYRRDASNFASTKRASDDASNRIEQSYVRKSETGSEVHDQGQDHQRFHEANREAHSTSTATYIDPDDDDSVDELQKRPSRIAQESFNQRARIDMNNKPYTRTYFDSENSDSEEDTMTPTLTSKHRPVSGVSRRTKAFASDSNRNKTTSMQSETARTTERGVERKSSSRSSYTTVSHHKSQSEIGNLGLWGNPEQSQSSEQAAPEKYPVPKESPRSISSSKKHGTESESKILDTRRSSAQPSYGDTRKSLDYHGSSAQPSSGDTRSSRSVMESRRSSFDKKLESSGKSTSIPPSTVASSGSAESLKTPSREDSLNQASHVHPKLPDYDTLAAQLLSIRRNRQ